MIKAIIIDDEIHCLDTLNILLTDYCPEVQVVEQCVLARKAIGAIEKHKPDLIFLDIEMPAMNGFELLEQLVPFSFSLIFTTSYDQYAIKAIKFSALDYLLKPIDPKELVAAVQKVRTKKHPPSLEQFQVLLNHIQHKEANFNKLAVPTSEGYELLLVTDIVRCEADDNYTHVFLKNKKKITACRTLKEIEEQLDSFASFLRVHHSYLVNLNEISRYIRGEGGYLIMSDGSTVNVSRSRKDALLKFF
ncbi:MAG: DNA-binding response regulator [Bacteroidetes bacterium]|nr:MAG: DNA-binding response regulator [Bacteroidota bacterium]